MGAPGLPKKRHGTFFMFHVQSSHVQPTPPTLPASHLLPTLPMLPVLSYVCSMLFALPVALQSYWYCYSKEGIFLICVMSLVFEGNTHRTKEIVEVEDEVR